MNDLGEFLLTTGRTLAQMALYSPDHPSVKGAVDESHRQLTALLTSTPELVLSTHEKKLLVNGHTTDGLSEAVGRPFLQLLSLHGLHSLTFVRGIQLEEMAPFFRLASNEMRKSAMKAADFLQSNNVIHIRLNEARYARIGEDESVGKTGDVGAGAIGEPTENIWEKNAALPLNELLVKLINEAVPNNSDRNIIYERVRSLVKQEISSAVDKAVGEYQREKTRVINEQARTEGVVSEMAEGVVVVDDTGNVLMMNAAAENIYGVKLGNSVGKPLWQNVREEQMIALAKDLTVPTDKPMIKEVNLLGNKDVQTTLRASSATIQDINGRIVGMVSVLSDVTKQKELNRLQNEFMANVTHDLRAPIHALKLSVNAILEGSAGPVSTEQQKMLGMATRNVDRLARLIDDLLDFSKLESGKMEVRPQIIEVPGLLREAVASMESWSKSRGITVLYQEAAEVPPAFADADRILQVVNNLISNAIKFTPPGGQVTLRSRSFDERGKTYVLIEVEDTGKGIAVADQKRIFDRFTQLDNPEKTDIHGTGLGLSICKALIDLHKGRLFLQSPPSGKNSGSLFAFSLPSVQRTASAAAPVKVAAPALATPAPVKRVGFWRRLFGRGKLFLVVILAAAVAQARPYHGKVRRVLDSNVIQLNDGSKVRYLGIAVPPRGSEYAVEAMAASSAWVLGEEVRLEYGLQERDTDGVWLAYVFTDDVFVNEELIKQGLALVAPLSNEEQYVRTLVRAEMEAHDKRRGQWRNTTLETYPVRMQKSGVLKGSQ
jgi:PAS domain S-box-containing protein